MSSGILQGAHDLVLNSPRLEDHSHQTNITTINTTINAANSAAVTAEKRRGKPRRFAAPVELG